MRRVVVTGMGILSPLGNDLETVLERGIQGYNGIDRITKFSCESTKIKLAGEVRNFDPSATISRRDQRRYDLSSQYALVAATDAFKDAGLDTWEGYNPERTGVILGTGMGGLDTFQGDLFKAFEKQSTRMSPLFIPMVIPNMVAGNVAIALKAKGHCTAVSTACASSNHAIGDAYNRIRMGYEDIVVTGGSEAAINPYTVSGFDALSALSQSDDPQKGSMPFDKDRNGFVIAEGSGILILESLDQAKERGARIYGEIVGFGSTSDAYHMTAPDGIGSKRAMIQALEMAQISPDECDYINAHGTSTFLNDDLEAKAIMEIFGDNPRNLSVSSTKSMHGHALGAAGGIEAVLTMLMMNHNVVFPTINLNEKDVINTLNMVPNKAEYKQINTALSNSFGFGGHNAVIAFRKVAND